MCIHVCAQEQLWRGIKNETLDMVVSDHSPCVPEFKTSGDFLRAWGGISPLQFGAFLYRGSKRFVSTTFVRRLELENVSFSREYFKTLRN